MLGEERRSERAASEGGDRMRVKDVCNPTVVTISPDETVQDAARVMREHHVGDVIVVERQLTGVYPRGIITDRDLAVGILAQDVTDVRSITVKDVMGRELITAHAEEDIFEVVNRMRRYGVRRLPVINSLEVLVGIIAFDDIVRALAEKLLDLARLSPEQMERERMRRT
jgi:predicted transcriptional regulator